MKMNCYLNKMGHLPTISLLLVGILTKYFLVGESVEDGELRCPQVHWISIRYTLWGHVDSTIYETQPASLSDLY